jgi:DNA-binding XRE family transcriptional regulator
MFPDWFYTGGDSKMGSVTRQTIIAIEKQKYSPSLELAFRIAHAFEVPLEEVFSFDPENEPASS